MRKLNTRGRKCSFSTAVNPVMKTGKKLWNCLWPSLFGIFWYSGNKLKKGWSKFVDKMKSKKAKKKKMKMMEQKLMMRIIASQDNASNEDDVSSREGSIYSQQDSDRVRLLQTTQSIKLTMTICETWQIVAFWPNNIRRTVIWRTIWQQSKRTWWNSSCRMRCGALAAGLSASLMWVINISGSVECPGGLLSVGWGSVKACPWMVC